MTSMPSVWLRAIGPFIEVLVEKDGKWHVAIREKMPISDWPVSHIAEAPGDGWPVDRITNP